jgi:hypothetical protein
MGELSDDELKDIAQKAASNAGIEAGQVWRHYKGGLYVVVAVALKEDTLEPLVVYRSNKKGTVWARTFGDWTDWVSYAPTGTDEIQPARRFVRVRD